MATVRMRKLKIVGGDNDKKTILKLLTRSGCFEVCEAENAKAEEYRAGIETDILRENQVKVLNAINNLFALNEEDGKKNKKETVRLSLRHEDYAAVKNKEADLLKVCDDLERFNQERIDARSKIKDVEDDNLRLEAYKNVDMPFSHFHDTKTVGVLLAYGPIFASKEEFYSLGCYIEDYSTAEKSLWGILFEKEKREAIVQKLTEREFEICSFDYEKPATELIDENFKEIERLQKIDTEKLKESLENFERMTELKILYDILGIELEQTEAESKFFKFEDTVTIEGWTPEKNCALIEAKIKEEIENIFVESRDVIAGDEPPSLSVNAKLFRPFEGVTKGYGSHSYGEKDPTPFMSVFFFIFFGIMLGDAGYGLILALGGFAACLFLNREKSFKRSVLMFAICGISGIIFGLLFGGFFASGLLPPLWFNPMDDPIMMMIFSLALGVVHLLTGYTLRTVATIRKGIIPGQSTGTRIIRILDGIFDSLFMYMLFSGVLLLLMPIVFSDSEFPFTMIGIILLAGTLAGILLTGGRRSKTISGKFAGGFGGLYKLISVFSDVLSYSRLFGLALASGAIAMAFNELGMLVFSIPIAGYILGPVVFIVVHLFNLVLAALAAYVHDIRLQYVEFFGKFYEGSGRAFSPIGENTRFVIFSWNKEN